MTSTSNPNSFEDNIKLWVRLDNEAKRLQEQIRNLRDQKSQVGERIHTYVDTQNLSNAVVEISDGRLKFGEHNSTQSLTLGFVNECLSEIIKNPQQVDSIMEHIKNRRTIKSTPEIKRIYSKK
jgi:hypothetical protein